MDTSPKTFGTVTRPKETPKCPSSTPARPASVDHLRVHDKENGHLTPPKPPLLIQDASYAVEQALSIIKKEDIDDIVMSMLLLLLGSPGCMTSSKYFPSLIYLPVCLLFVFFLINSLLDF